MCTSARIRRPAKGSETCCTMSDSDWTGLTWRQEPGFFTNSQVALVSVTSGATITVRHQARYLTWHRQPRLTTQLTARLARPVPRLLLLREGTLRGWLRRFGYQDIQVGHADFDFRFTVKGDDEAAVRALLLPVAVPFLDAVDYIARVECDGTTITMLADARGAADHRGLPIGLLVNAMRAFLTAG